MAVKTVTGKATGPDGLVRAGATITATISQACVIPGTQEVVNSPVIATSATDGTYSLSLQANNDLTPTGTYYTVTEVAVDGGFYKRTIVVPQTAGPFVITSIETAPPTLGASPSHVSTLTVDALTAGRIPFASAGGLLADDGGLLWDNTAKALAASSLRSKGSPNYDLIAYGAKGDAQEITDAVISAGSPLLNSASGKFKSTDVNKKFYGLGLGPAIVGNPTVAISGADSGAGATTLPVGTYKFAYTWATRGYTGQTTAGTSEATYVQTIANHIITLTVPALPANAEVTEIYCTVAPAGAFIGRVGWTISTTFAYTTGATSNGASPPAASSAGATLATTIASYQSPTQVTLAANATLGSLGTSAMWGTDDSAARDAAVSAAVAAGGGEVFLPAVAGGYLLNTGATVNVPLVSFRGLNSKVFYTGAGDCFRVQLNPFVTNGQTGSLKSLVIDGNYALDGAVGIHYGDANQGTFEDVTVRCFNGIGSKGIWMDNRTNWCERHVFDRVWIYANTVGLLFDINGGDPSFAHSFIFNLKVSVGIGQVAVQLKNGAALVNSLFHMTGNSDVLGTSLQLLDTAKCGSNLAPNAFAITMEDSGPLAAVAVGLDMSAGSVLFGTGVINFGIGNYTNKDAFSSFTNIQFAGQFNCPGIYASQGESFTAFGTGIRAPNGGGVRVQGNAGFTSDGNSLFLEAAVGTGAVYLRPNGPGSDVNRGAYWPGGSFAPAAQLYPGSEAVGLQTVGGFLHSTGIPSNANGNNSDWCISDNGHLYFKTGGSWVQKI